MGPDSKEGYGCDNMSVLIVQLKDRVKTRARACIAPCVILMMFAVCTRSHLLSR